MTPQAALSWLRLWQHTLPEAGEVADLVTRLQREAEAADSMRRKLAWIRMTARIATKPSRMPQDGRTGQEGAGRSSGRREGAKSKLCRFQEGRTA